MRGTHESDAELLGLWAAWTREGDLSARNRLVLCLAPVVKQVVVKRGRQLPRHCELDDFLSSGLEALIRAIDRYDPARGTTLEQFVSARVNGAVLDEARRQDWAPRSLRAFQRERDRVARVFAAVHGRRPARGDLARALEMSEEDVRRLEDKLAVADVHSLNMPVGAPDSEDEPVELVDTLCSPEGGPEELLVAALGEGRVHDAIEGLSERDREVVELLYVEDLTMRQVGDRLGVTESRVSQLNSRIKRSVEQALVAA